MRRFPRSAGAGARDAAPPRAPLDRRRAGRRRTAGRDPLEWPARTGRGLQRLAGRRIVVARADRTRLLQGRRDALAGARLPRPCRRDVAPRAAVRLTRTIPGAGCQPIGDPSITVTTRRSPKSATTKASAWKSLERVDRCCTTSPL